MLLLLLVVVMLMCVHSFGPFWHRHMLCMTLSESYLSKTDQLMLMAKNDNNTLCFSLGFCFLHPMKNGKI